MGTKPPRVQDNHPQPPGAIDSGVCSALLPAQPSPGTRGAVTAVLALPHHVLAEGRVMLLDPEHLFPSLQPTRPWLGTHFPLRRGFLTAGNQGLLSRRCPRLGPRAKPSSAPSLFICSQNGLGSSLTARPDLQGARRSPQPRAPAPWPRRALLRQHAAPPSPAGSVCPALLTTLIRAINHQPGRQQSLAPAAAWC